MRVFFHPYCKSHQLFVTSCKTKGYNILSLPTSIHEVPLFRLLIPFSAGIAVQTFFGILPPSSFIAIIPLVTFTLLWLSYILLQKWQHRWIYGTALNLFLLTCGLTLAVNLSFSKELEAEKDFKVIVKVIENPHQKVRSIRAKCKIEKLLINKQYINSQENIILYFNSTDTLANNLKYGDILSTTIYPRTFEKPKNPHQFDIGKNMLQEGIRFSAHVKPENWMILGNNGNRLIAKSLRIRDYLLAQFSRFGITDNQLAVLSALTLGYKDLLDEELRKIYSSTGAMHILAVSGLHVGILYFILALILGLLPSFGKNSKFIKLLIILIFLWFFALLTGLSPSVCRSAIMFSLVAIGQSFGARSNIFNTLSVAAFALLVANPSNLLNLGFQLSFIAVISIVVFYPHIHRLLYFKNKAAEYTWSLISVSIAAQIGTFPLTAAYFAQFPNYFIITNLLAIPLATGILWATVLLIIFSPIPVIAIWIGKLLNILLVILNSGLGWIENLPVSTISGIHISSIQLILLIVALIYFAIFLNNKRIIGIQLVLASLIGVLALNISHKLKTSTNELVIFSTPKKSAICFRNNGMANFVVTDTATNDPVKTNSFYISGYISKETLNGKYIVLNNKGDRGITIRKKGGIALVNSNNLTIAVPYNDSALNVKSSRRIYVDILIANKSYSNNILDYITPKTVIIDGSIPHWIIDKTLISLAERQINTYDLRTEGAYRKKLH